MGITIDDSPVTFWDKFLALDPEDLIRLSNKLQMLLVNLTTVYLN